MYSLISNTARCVPVEIRPSLHILRMVADEHIPFVQHGVRSGMSAYSDHLLLHTHSFVSGGNENNLKRNDVNS